MLEPATCAHEFVTAVKANCGFSTTAVKTNGTRHIAEDMQRSKQETWPRKCEQGRARLDQLSGAGDFASTSLTTSAGHILGYSLAEYDTVRDKCLSSRPTSIITPWRPQFLHSGAQLPTMTMVSATGKRWVA